MKKWVFTFLVGLMMMISLVGCSGSKDPVGTYNLISMNSGGMELSVKELAGLFEIDVDITLELKADNSFLLDMGFFMEDEGESITGTWKLDGDSLILSRDGEELPVTFDGKTVVMDMEGEILTFEKQ